MKIGFIGLGNMGRHMARHLIVAGNAVTVHDVREDAAAEHVRLGARWAATPADCASDVDVLITMLPTPRRGPARSSPGLGSPATRRSACG